jgi:hypothetical protein
MLEMDPEIRAQWTAALRSGKYPQGRSVLRKDDELCCLGVLCELARAAGHLGARCCEDGTWVYGNGETEYLPAAVAEWAGITHGAHNPAVIALVDEDGPGPMELALLNDEYQWTFAQIADAIDGTGQTATAVAG